MPALHEWQRALLATLLEAGDAPVDLDGLQLRAFDARGIAVHRHTRRANLHGALRIAYPVVERLVGAEFFEFAARHFIESHPSTSANLEDYGFEFGEFLRGFPPAAELPYLADVAALEAAIQSVAIAPDDTAERELHSPFPVLRIWQVNQPGWSGDDTVSLDAGAAHLRVHRAGGEVLIVTIAVPVPNEPAHAR